MIIEVLSFCLLLSGETQTQVATVRNQPIYFEEIQTQTITDLRNKLEQLSKATDAEKLPIRQELFKHMERAIAEKAADILENHPKDDDPDHLLDHFRNSVKKGEVVLMIDVPPPPVFQVPLGEAYVRKNEGAPVMMMVFIDSQCPYCAEITPYFKRLERIFSKKLALAIRHLPLESHKGADVAAMAMECAREQGFFEFMHEALVSRPDQQTPEDLARYAAQANAADLENFKACLSEKRYTGRLKEDEALVQMLGLKSTPSVVIGRFDAKTRILTGEISEGALDFAEYKEIIERYLQEPNAK